MQVLKPNLTPISPHRTLWLAGVLLVLRWTLDRTVVPLIEGWLAKYGKAADAMKFFNDVSAANGKAPQ
jgi:hypothetical protein